MGLGVTMIDKIDRPSAPEPWKIKETAKSQDRGQEREQQQPFQEDEFSSPGERSDVWQRLQGRQSSRRVVKVRREDVKHVWFLKAQLLHHHTLVECNFELHDGKILQHAQVILPRLDDYFQFKGFRTGQEVSVTNFHEPVLELSIPSNAARKPISRAQPHVTPLPPTHAPSWWQLWDYEKDEIHWRALAVYCVAIFATISLVIILL